MLIHHTTLLLLLGKAVVRLKQEGKPRDQLIALFDEVDKMSEQAEAHDEELRKALAGLKEEVCPGCFMKKSDCNCKHGKTRQA